MKFENDKKFYRTIWVSDTHLGTSGCKSKMLLEFLEETDSEYLFLVGDIVDGSVSYTHLTLPTICSV